MATGRLAVVLFNLGGPDRPEAVRPFLFNLFNDPAIIGAPAPFRWLIAQLISRRRAPVARAIYDEIGGKSPIVAQTAVQAEALQAALGDPGETKVFVAMRYWHPMSAQCARAVKAFGPDRVVLLPLYPQFSTTTTGSSLTAWRRAAAACGLDAPTAAVGCYPTAPGFIQGHVEKLRPALRQARDGGRPRVLFSAHGLPKKVIEAGDPYQWQVERTVAAITEALDEPDLDWVICYQSRVGPLEWIGPSTDSEIARAGADGVPLVVVPVAFVSEHSETLVELDIEYRKLAGECGVPAYYRVPALGAAPPFIDALAAMATGAGNEPGPSSDQGVRLCPGTFTGCPCIDRETQR